jgi:hypothetical protein
VEWALVLASSTGRFGYFGVERERGETGKKLGDEGVGGRVC